MTFCGVYNIYLSWQALQTWTWTISTKTTSKFAHRLRGSSPSEATPTPSSRIASLWTVMSPWNLNHNHALMIVIRVNYGSLTPWNRKIRSLLSSTLWNFENVPFDFILHYLLCSQSLLFIYFLTFLILIGNR